LYLFETLMKSSTDVKSLEIIMLTSSRQSLRNPSKDGKSKAL
jgi:hypothetical protein